MLVRLAVGHRGRNLGHLLGVVLGMTLAVVVLLAAVGIDAALTAQAGLKLARDGAVEDLGHEESPAAVLPAEGSALLRSTLLVDTSGGLLTVTRVAAEGADPPDLAGVVAPPGTGEVLVSPALAAALADPATAALRGWLPGDPTGVLSDTTLVHPRELAAVAGVSADEIRRGGRYEAVTRGAPPPSVPEGASGARRLLLALAVFAILVPVGSLIAVAVRLSATRRDRRNATLRLIGATPGQVRAVLVAEAAMASAGACLLGLAGAAGFLRVSDAVSLGGVALYTRDLAPGWPTVAGVVAFTVVVAVVVATAATRRLVLSPLGTQRRSQSISLRWTRAAWLLVGAAALAAEGVLARRGAPEGALYALLVAGLAATVVGLVRATPLLIRRLAQAAAWTPASMVAARRLQFDPHLGYRVVVGLALGAFSFGYVQVAGPGTAAAPSVESRADLTVEMRTADAPGLPDALRRVGGVEDVVAVRDEVVRLPDDTVSPLSVGACAGLLRQLRVELVDGGCDERGVVVPAAVAGRLGLRVGDAVPLELPGLLPSALDDPEAPPAAETRRVSGVYRSEFEQVLGVLYDAAADPDLPFQRLYVATNGDPRVQQEVFAVTAATAPGASAQTATMRAAGAAQSAQRAQQGLNVVLLGAVVIGTAAFAYGVLGMLADRSNLLALLRAIGMGRKGLVAMLGVELAVPLLAAVGASLCVGLAVASAQLASLARPVSVPVPPVVQFLLVVGVAALALLVVLGILVVLLTKTRPNASA